MRLASGGLVWPSTPVLGEGGAMSLLLNLLRGNRWVLVLLRSSDPA